MTRRGLHVAAQQMIGHHSDNSNNLIKEQRCVTTKAFHQLGTTQKKKAAIEYTGIP
jgi:hypothetical protein